MRKAFTRDTTRRGDRRTRLTRWPPPFGGHEGDEVVLAGILAAPGAQVHVVIAQATRLPRGCHPPARPVLRIVAAPPHRLLKIISPTPTITTASRHSSCGEAAPSPQSVLTAAASPPALSSAEVTRAILASTTTADPIDSPYPPPFSSLYFPPNDCTDAAGKAVRTDSPEPPPQCEQLPPFSSLPPPRPGSSSAAAAERVLADTKAALPRDTKDREGSSSKDFDDGEPPPPYSEGSSPIPSFTYVMATAGGPASIITQVQQGGGAPINTLATGSADENISLDLRGTRFTLSRDELLTLPEFVLLSLFPNGLLPDGHMSSFHDGDIYPVDYDPLCLQYMLDFFRHVAQTIPTGPPSPTADSSQQPETVPIEPMQGSSTRDMLQDRAGIIVLREDLDYYVIPPRKDIEHAEMIEVKRAAGRALRQQDGIFSGLRKSDEPGTTEQHLIEMLTAGGFNHDDRWGHRANEPNKAVICSVALARLRTDIRGNDLSSNAVGMAQKLLLFWRKPARRCWWEGVELENVEGVEGKLKVWIRRVWTLEMSVIGLR
ncbi:uncharacterized protein PV09_02633 [Verruconis gallopava]|uniref:Uncharacterized protein n=1 Tax=Verruconis gallopava TaxID=253628 RepID=A0A0D2AJ99_9PEZI|nr:uncharacterized protein PV09_02633 [Verruconis gallopava]KIW06973.1 hypothetical protein PV09_02633 [Verruconis gallopava]